MVVCLEVIFRLAWTLRNKLSRSSEEVNNFSVRGHNEPFRSLSKNGFTSESMRQTGTADKNTNPTLTQCLACREHRVRVRTCTTAPLTWFTQCLVGLRLYSVSVTGRNLVTIDSVNRLRVCVRFRLYNLIVI